MTKARWPVGRGRRAEIVRRLAAAAGSPPGGQNSVCMIRRLRPLAGTLLGLILLGWGMGVLVLHVAHGFFHGWVDHPINHFVRIHHSRGLGRVLIQVAHLGSEPVVVAVTLVAGGVWARRRRNVAPFVALFLGSTGAAVIALVVKVAVHRGQSTLPGTFAGLTELAFPSGHATLAAGLYGTMAFLVARRADRPPWCRPAVAGLVGLALVIGIARVYNRQHDTTDVVAGWILGGLWAWAVATFDSGRRHRRPAVDGMTGRGEDAAPTPGPPLSVPPESDGTGVGGRRRRGRRRRTGRSLDAAAASAAPASPVPAAVMAVGRVLPGRRG